MKLKSDDNKREEIVTLNVPLPINIRTLIPTINFRISNVELMFPTFDLTDTCTLFTEHRAPNQFDLLKIAAQT